VAQKLSGRATPPRPCFFCSARVPLTREHVLPDWLRNIGFKGDGNRQIVEDGGTPIVQPGGPFTKTLKIVCGPCKNEWMGGMETASQPILIEMFKAAATHSQTMLTAEKQLALARWGLKTVAVLSQLRPSGRFPERHRRTFHDTDQIPSGVQIWLGAATVPIIEPLGTQVAQSRFQPKQMTITVGEFEQKEKIAAALRLFNVVFYVTGFDSPHWQLESGLSDDLRAALLPLMPVEHPKLWWPPARSVDEFGGIDGLMGVPMTGVPGFVA
jgi:hypothetical protein